MSEKLTIFFLTDVHASDFPDGPFILEPSDYRRYSTAVTRSAEAVTESNNQNPDIFVHGGDLVDFFTSPEEVRAKGQFIITEFANLTAPFLCTVGNHERVAYNGEAGRPTVSDMYTDIDTIHAPRSNTYEDSDGFISFTYDIKGIRLIFLDSDGSVDIEAGTLSWFQGELGSSDLPVIVISHYPVVKILEAPHTWATHDSEVAIRDAIDDAGNVQTYLCGHYHLNNMDETYNNIQYINFWGSVSASNEEDNAYFKIEIIPEAVYTTNGMKPNIKITGYGTNGVAKTRDYTRYLVA